MKKAIIVLSLLVVGGLMWSLATVGGAEAEREYVFSSDPDEAIFNFRSWGGLNPEVYEYTLFGDGRVVRTIGQKERVDSRKLGNLAFVEVDDLVRLAVDGGLMEWDHGEIQKRLREQIGGPPTVPSDSPRLRVTMRLDEYRSQSGEKVAPAEIQFDTSPPSLLKVMHPELALPELDALSALYSRIEALFGVSLIWRFPVSLGRLKD